MSRSLERLGAMIASQQDALLNQGDALVRGRAPVLASRGKKSRRVGLGLVLAAALVLGFFTLRPRAPGALAFTVDGEQAGQAGRWWSAVEGPRVLLFSEGSSITLAEGAQLRVMELGEHGARVHLERGSAHFSVVHAPATRWTISAGPFDTIVLGTRFNLRWQPEAGAFALTMEEGEVALAGPTLDGRHARTGETVYARFPAETGAESAAAVRPVAAPLVDAAVPPPMPVVPEPRGARMRPRAERASVVLPTSVAPPTPDALPEPLRSFEELLREGRYSEILARASNWEENLTTLSASSLLALADAARLSRELPRAEQAYLRLRARFPGSAPAARAAFELGRIAFDRKHEPAQAAGWFDAYLREGPHGALMCDALGRLIEAQRASAEAARARDSAARYRQACPDGSHSALARSLLEAKP